MVGEWEEREGVERVLGGEWIGEEWGKVGKVIGGEERVGKGGEMIMMCENVKNGERREEGVGSYGEG